MKAAVKENQILVAVDLNETRPISSSGKTYLVANGYTTIALKNEVVKVTVMATVPNPEYKKA